MLKTALQLCNAVEWHGQEPKLDFWTKMLAGRIAGYAYPFWEQSPDAILAELGTDNGGKFLERLDACDPVLLGFALWQERTTYLAALHESGQDDYTTEDSFLQLQDLSFDGGPWTSFVCDEQLAEPQYNAIKESAAFRELVAISVPTALLPRMHCVADLETVIWAHHMALLEYRSACLRHIRRSVPKWVVAKLKVFNPLVGVQMFLDIRMTTEEGYCFQRPGLSPGEYADFAAGRLTLDTLYCLRPAFILRPLLARPTGLH